MRAVADTAPELAGLAGERARRALRARGAPTPFDRDAGRAELLAALTRVGWTPAG
jgi:beta-N-acetylhexosaminidase